jgi:hypothetical protein
MFFLEGFATIADEAVQFLEDLAVLAETTGKQRDRAGSHREGNMQERQSSVNTWCCWQPRIARLAYFWQSSIEHNNGVSIVQVS